MRRAWHPLPLIAALLLGLTCSGRLAASAVAQESTPAGAPGHPLVGAWVLDLGEDGGRLLTFSADGTVLFTDIDGTTGHGSWEATGSQSGRFTTVSLTATQDAQIEGNLIFAGYFLLAGDVEVDVAGRRWTGNLAVAELDPAGTIQSMDGPFTLSAERIPVTPIDQLVPGSTVAGIPAAATPAP